MGQLKSLDLSWPRNPVFLPVLIFPGEITNPNKRRRKVHSFRWYGQDLAFTRSEPNGWSLWAITLPPNKRLDLLGRVVSIKRGPYRKSALTRTAKRLLAYLKVVTAKSRTGWADINLGQIASYLGVSRTSVQTAKASLESKKLLVFRSISNVRGRKGHLVLVGDPEKVQEDLHPKDVHGRTRNRWTRVRRQRLLDGRGDYWGDLLMERSQWARLHPLPFPNRKCSQNPHFPRVGTKTTFSSRIQGGLSSDENTLPDGAVGCRLASSNLQAKPLGGRGKGRVASRAQVQLAHWVKKRALGEFWDNAKVEKPSNPGQIFNFALRWIQKGTCINQILKAFSEALHELHGTATDVGLMTGDATMKFNVSSTIVRADRLLTAKFWNGCMTFWDPALTFGG